MGIDMANPFMTSGMGSAADALPVFHEFAWDFERNAFLYEADGSHKIVTQNEAIKVWAWHVLQCERYRYLAYFDDYGIELEQFIGTGPNDGRRAGELFQYVKEGLLVNPYITDVSNLRIERTKKSVAMLLNLSTVYGDTSMRIEV